MTSINHYGILPLMAYTVKQAAAELGVSKSRVHWLCAHYGLDLERVDPSIPNSPALITDAQMEKLRSRRPQAGRPKKNLSAVVDNT